jgi:hypothetical protein
MEKCGVRGLALSLNVKQFKWSRDTDRFMERYGTDCQCEAVASPRSSD